MKGANKKIVSEWLEKANSDLAFAQASFNDFDDFYGQMCVLCHDAVEKYLKAFLVSHGIRPMRIHDLIALSTQCTKLSDVFGDYREDCAILNRYYTPIKYPSHYPTPTREQAKEAIEIATRIKEIVCKKLI